MTDKRSYHQYCGLARALDVLGERWTLLIVRNLLLGPRRYTDLMNELPGITTNLLAKRMRELEQAGIVEKSTLPAPARSEVYMLSERGAALEPSIMELARWGGPLMGTPRRDDRVDIGWGLLSMKRRYRGGLSLVVELCIDERRFELSFEPAYLRVQERPAARPELMLTGSAETFRRLFWGGLSGDELRAQGALEVLGARSSWRMFLRAFADAAPASASSAR